MELAWNLLVVKASGWSLASKLVVEDFSFSLWLKLVVVVSPYWSLLLACCGTCCLHAAETPVPYDLGNIGCRNRSPRYGRDDWIVCYGWKMFVARLSGRCGWCGSWSLILWCVLRSLRDHFGGHVSRVVKRNGQLDVVRSKFIGVSCALVHLR